MRVKVDMQDRLKALASLANISRAGQAERQHLMVLAESLFSVDDAITNAILVAIATVGATIGKCEQCKEWFIKRMPFQRYCCRRCTNREMFKRYAARHPEHIATRNAQRKAQRAAGRARCA